MTINTSGSISCKRVCTGAIGLSVRSAIFAARLRRFTRPGGGRSGVKSGRPPMAGHVTSGHCVCTSQRRDEMRGTMICGVDDSDEGRGAVELGVELSERLGLRLVL